MRLLEEQVAWLSDRTCEREAAEVYRAGFTVRSLAGGAGIKIRFDITLGAGEEVDEVAGGASGMTE
jgi:hypothetical protein